MNLTETELTRLESVIPEAWTTVIFGARHAIDPVVLNRDEALAQVLALFAERDLGLDSLHWNGAKTDRRGVYYIHNDTDDDPLIQVCEIWDYRAVEAADIMILGSLIPPSWSKVVFIRGDSVVRMTRSAAIAAMLLQCKKQQVGPECLEAVGEKNIHLYYREAAKGTSPLTIQPICVICNDSEFFTWPVF